MPAVLPIPPSGVPVFDPTTGLMNEDWRRYWLSIENAQAISAPIDARYWVSTANTELSNEQDIGLLSSGYLKVSTVVGIATPSTVASIPGSDVTSAALTRTNDTNVTLTLGGSPTSALLAATSLTLGWSGQLGLSRGGTNADLSSTGGTSRVLRQSSSGAAITVSQLATTDISGLASGTYTPTLTNVANITASTAATTRYTRIGDIVSVYGVVDIDPTSATTVSQMTLSLPIASNFANASDCAGVAATGGVTGYSGSIVAGTVGDVALLTFTTATDVASQTWGFTFGYTVI